MVWLTTPWHLGSGVSPVRPGVTCAVPQPCSATQSHPRQLPAHPASWVSVPPFPGALLPRGKGSVTQWGEHSTHRWGEKGGPSTPGHPSRKEIHPLKTPFPGHLVPSVLGGAPVTHRGQWQRFLWVLPQPWVPREILGGPGGALGGPQGKGKFTALEHLLAWRWEK